MTDPITPMATDSSITETQHLTPRGAERAQRRELAHALSDRDRERVRDHEATDEEREAAEPEQEVLDEAQAILRLLAVRGRLSGAGLDLRRLGQERPDLLDQLRIGDAVCGADADHVELAALVEQHLRGREVEDRDRRAAERVLLAEADEAADPVLRDRPLAERADRVADREVLLRGRGLVDARSGGRRSASCRRRAGAG